MQKTIEMENECILALDENAAIELFPEQHVLGSVLKGSIVHV